MENTKTVILEYVWLDGYTTSNLRSKVKVHQLTQTDIENLTNTHHWNNPESVECCIPKWNFDGSSTMQAPGENSECVLRPVRAYVWNKKTNHFLILCEVLDENGPHKTNTREKLQELLWPTKGESHPNTFWWGFEQEYFITQDFLPLGFPKGGYPKPQGLYYCGVGGNQVRGRQLVEAHLHKCLEMGITLTGTNAEVAVGQWEYQCFAMDTLKACDDLWISRYVLYRLSEEFGFDIDITPKPVMGDWNGSGCHTNFSNEHMRTVGGEAYIKTVMSTFEKNHQTHINDYGENNDQRLTGHHETQHIGTFSWGVGDRGASIRVPKIVPTQDWKGYLEDRRPASNCDPYLVALHIIHSVDEAENTYFSKNQQVNVVN